MPPAPLWLVHFLARCVPLGERRLSNTFIVLLDRSRAILNYEPSIVALGLLFQRSNHLGAAHPLVLLRCEGVAYALHIYAASGMRAKREVVSSIHFKQTMRTCQRR